MKSEIAMKETGDRRQETGRQEIGAGDRRWETGDETGDRRKLTLKGLGF